MAEKYDVVVVGAGNAGLSAAVSCAAQGKKTLLIEKHNLPGGVASSFKRGRFEFDPSVHEICDYGADNDKGHVRLIMEKNGVKIDWVTVPDCYRAISTYSDGTPYGFEVSEWDGVIARMMDIEADFNVKGLRHIGAGSFFADGYSSTWINGDMTAGLACAEIDKGGKE